MLSLKPSSTLSSLFLCLTHSAPRTLSFSLCFLSLFLCSLSLQPSICTLFLSLFLNLSIWSLWSLSLLPLFAHSLPLFAPSLYSLSLTLLALSLNHLFFQLKYFLHFSHWCWLHSAAESPQHLLFHWKLQGVMESEIQNIKNISPRHLLSMWTYPLS